VTRRANDRLVVAAATTAAGALVAVLGGVTEAAILAAPWAVMLLLAMSHPSARPPEATISVATDRLIVGDDVTVNTSVTFDAGAVRVSCLPERSFWPDGETARATATSRACELVVAGHATVRATLPALRWGTYDVGRVHVRMTEPFGLFRWEGVIDTPLPVRVHPTPAALHNLLAPWLVRRVTGAHPSRAVGRGVEYADMRPYSPGDSLREINWRASARSTRLWVSQRHPDRASDVILLLDSFVESGHDVHAVVGLAIEAAVALAESHLSVTDRVGLIELGGVVRWVSPGTGSFQLQRLTDALLATGLYANVAARPLHVIPPRALPPRSFVVALTPLLDDRFIEALLVLAGRGHDVAVIECHADPANSHPADETGGLARRFWEATRQVVRDRLAEHGIAVAGWRPGGHLSLTLDALTIRRRHSLRVGRR